jgi:hypothetical protein
MVKQSLFWGTWWREEAASYVEQIGRRNPEAAWLSDFLTPPAEPMFPPRFETQLTIVDINSNGRQVQDRLRWKRFPFDWEKASSELSDIATRGRADDTRVRIIHVGLQTENKEDIDTRVIDKLALELRISEDFFFDHFFPSLPCDRKITWAGHSLSHTPLAPSARRYFRLKDHEGSNISAVFIAAGKDFSLRTGTCGVTRPPSGAVVQRTVRTRYLANGFRL